MSLNEQKSLRLNSILNVIKQLCVIMFPMITFPYASRVLGATNYGKVNFGLSIISYVSLIAGLGVTNYAIREGARIRQENSRVQKFINQIFTLNIFSTIFAYLILAVLLIFWHDLEMYRSLILVQSIVVFFTTMGVDWINSIYEDYLYITIRYLICQIVAVVLLFLFVKGPEDYIIYAVVTASSTILANIWNWFHISKYNIKLRILPFKETLPHWKPVLIMFGSAVASLIYINSDLTILGIMTTDERVGYYSVSVKIYTLVKQLINAALIVTIPRFSYELAKGKIKEFGEKVSFLQTGLILVTIPAMTGIYVLSKEIVTLFAGKSFLPAASSLQLLSISLIFAILANLYINVIMIPLKKEKLILIATLISAIANIVLNFLLIPTFLEDGSAIATIVSEAIMVLFGWLTVRKILPSQSFIKPLLISLLNIVCVFISYHFVVTKISDNFLIILSTIFISVIGVSLITGVSYYKEIKSFVKN